MGGSSSVVVYERAVQDAADKFGISEEAADSLMVSYRQFGADPVPWEKFLAKFNFSTANTCDNLKAYMKVGTTVSYEQFVSLATLNSPSLTNPELEKLAFSLFSINKQFSIPLFISEMKSSLLFSYFKDPAMIESVLKGGDQNAPNTLTFDQFTSKYRDTDFHMADLIRQFLFGSDLFT